MTCLVRSLNVIITLLESIPSLYQVGGVHFSLLSKVQYDIGDSRPLDSLIDSIFPLFRRHIEPDLHHAQVGLSTFFSSKHVVLAYSLDLFSADQNQQ